MSRQTASDNETKKPSKSNTTEKQVTPNFDMRESLQMFHHLFKGVVSAMKKNVSFTPGYPNIQDVEHTHFFHSINSGGQPQKYTSEVGGHFHEIEWALGENGKPKIMKCGPALKKITKRGRNGLPVTSIVQVEFLDKGAEQGPGKIVDAHTHQFNYLGTDAISTNKISEIQKNNYEALKHMGVKAPSTGEPQTDETILVDNDR